MRSKNQTAIFTILGTIATFIIIVLVFIYNDFLLNQFYIRSNVYGGKTEISNINFKFRFSVNDTCEVDPQWSNYLITKDWAAWLKCSSDKTLIRMSVLSKQDYEAKISQDQVSTSITSSERISFRLDSEKKSSSIAIEHPQRNEIFVISGFGNDITVIDKITQSIVEIEL